MLDSEVTLGLKYWTRRLGKPVYLANGTCMLIKAQVIERLEHLVFDLFGLFFEDL